MRHMSPPSTQRHIGLLLFEDVEELDAVGPWEVLAYWTLQHPEDGWTVSCLSADGAAVTGPRVWSWVPTSPWPTPRRWTC